MERTLSIIKPDAVQKNLIGKILSVFEENNLKIIAIKRMHLSYKEAAAFYAVHKGRPFFNTLCDFMSSGPCVVQVLEGTNAILKNRELMGATNPAEAAQNTIRNLYAESIDYNAVHGSDSIETAKNEIQFFFSELEII